MAPDESPLPLGVTQTCRCARQAIEEPFSFFYTDQLRIQAREETAKKLRDPNRFQKTFVSAHLPCTLLKVQCSFVAGHRRFSLPSTRRAKNSPRSTFEDRFQTLQAEVCSALRCSSALVELFALQVARYLCG